MYAFENLPGYCQLTDEEVSAYEEYIKAKIVPLLNKQELDKEQEAAKVAMRVTD